MMKKKIKNKVTTSEIIKIYMKRSFFFLLELTTELEDRKHEYQQHEKKKKYG